MAFALSALHLWDSGSATPLSIFLFPTQANAICIAMIHLELANKKTWSISIYTPRKASAKTTLDYCFAELGEMVT